MEYAKLINAIGACMQVEARCFTRYNKSVMKGEGADAGMSARDTKFVVVDYKNTDASFHIRAGQIQFNGMAVGIDQFIEMIKKEDSSLIVHRYIEEAIQASLGEKYLSAANDILAIAKGYVNERNDECLIKFASFVNKERNPGVTIFVACPDQTVVLSITE